MQCETFCFDFNGFLTIILICTVFTKRPNPSSKKPKFTGKDLYYARRKKNGLIEVLLKLITISYFSVL